MYNRYIKGEDGTYIKTEVHGNNPVFPSHEAIIHHAAPYHEEGGHLEGCQCEDCLERARPGRPIAGGGAKGQSFLSRLLPEKLDLGDILLIILLALLLLDGEEDELVILIAVIVFFLL